MAIGGLPAGSYGPKDRSFFILIFVRKSRHRNDNISDDDRNQRGTGRLQSIYVEAWPTSPLLTATILLARHATHSEVGQRLSGRSEIALDGRGRAEAERLAGRLAREPLGAVLSSPRARARETAETVAARHGLPVTIEPALDEIDFGDWSGRSFAELADDPAWTHWNDRRGSARPPQGESMAEAIGRVMTLLASLHGDRPILCVTHCDIIRGVVAHVLGLDTDGLLGFDVDPASLSGIALGDGWHRLLFLNERPA